MMPKQSIRETLVRRRDELIRQHGALHDREEELRGEREPDLPDAAAAATSATLLERLDEADLAELRRVTRAIERIDAGQYERCAACGRRIPGARLRAIPEADRCAACAEPH